MEAGKYPPPTLAPLAKLTAVPMTIQRRVRYTGSNAGTARRAFSLHGRGELRQSRTGATGRWCLPPAQSAREPAMAVREPACEGAARGRADTARDRAARNRAIPQVRRPASRLCAHLLRRLRARLPARLLLQDALLLPELSPETGARVRRVGRRERPRARGVPAVRVHRAAAAAPDLRPASGMAR